MNENSIAILTLNQHGVDIATHRCANRIVDWRLANSVRIVVTLEGERQFILQYTRAYEAYPLA